MVDDPHEALAVVQDGHIQRGISGGGYEDADPPSHTAGLSARYDVAPVAVAWFGASPLVVGFPYGVAPLPFLKVSLCPRPRVGALDGGWHLTPPHPAPL